MTQQEINRTRMGREALAVLRVGMLMMGAGTGGYRVLRGMKRVARAMNFDGVNADVSINSITCTLRRGKTFRTVVANQANPSVDSSRIAALEHLTRHSAAPLRLEDLNDQLDEIEFRMAPRWPVWVQAIAAGVACSGFAVLNQVSPAQIWIVALAAAIGQLVRVLMTKKHFNQLGTVGLAAATAFLTYTLVSLAASAIGHLPSATFATGHVVSVLFLIPGFPLFSALLDLSRFDIQAGLSRLTYALLIIFAAATPVGLASWIIGQAPLPSQPDVVPSNWYLFAAIATLASTAGFGILFNSNLKMIFWAALAGCFGNTTRLILTHHELTPAPLACFIGGLLIGLLITVINRFDRALPRITLTVPASLTTVPGVAIYRFVYWLNQGDMTQALSNLTTATLWITSVAAGLIVARMVTDRNWAFAHPIDFSHTEPTATFTKIEES